MFTDPSNSLVFSPSDLIAYLEGDFAAWMERLAVERGRSGAENLPRWKPDPADQTDELVQRKGQEHEQRYLQSLTTQGRNVVQISADESLAQTRRAMAGGAEVIYQAHLSAGSWHGYPDFLFRVPGASRLGDYHYEPWDTKLARSTRAHFLVQLSAYADLLEAVQGLRPRECATVLGTGVVERFLVDEFFYYYRNLKRDFLAFQERFDPNRMPDPGLERSHGRWSEAASEILAAADHLSQVAGITRSQIQQFEAAGVKAFADLASLDERPIKGIKALTRDRLRAQARQQVRSRGAEVPSWQFAPLRPDEPRRGFALLPPPSELDVWFDMEGFPFVDPRLEYLFGAVCFESGQSIFHDWWAHDAAQEKQAFEVFIDWVFDRWTRDPSMHIYHYAAYERTALKELMGRYATREAEVDALLRGEVLVDLCTITRQAMVIGTPSYSLKDVERLVASARSTAVGTATDSTVAYQQWLDLGEPQAWRTSPRLEAIRRYNNDDCERTRLLHRWLLDRQRESGIAWLPESAATVGPAEARKPPSEAEQLASRMLEEVAAGRPLDEERRRVTELVAWLLEFHRREDKPTWWRYFDLLEADDEEREEDPYCLTGLVRTDRPRAPVKKSWGYEYRYDPDADTKIAVGSNVICAHNPKAAGEITAMDAERGLLEVKLGPSVGQPPANLTLILHEYVNPKVIAEAVMRFASSWREGKSPSRAVDDLLFRRPPRLLGHSGGPLPGDVVKVARRMEETCLCIQGPPGAGKTWTAAGLIAALLADGKRVAVTGNSHKVILNLLEAVIKARARTPFTAPMLKVVGDDESELAALGIAPVKENAALAAAVAPRGPVVAGATAWALCRDDVAGAFDYLVVDEAGQVSLANVVGMGLCARNIILVGDQMQLSQPTQGIHPGESGVSALDYLLNGMATIPDDFGVFLPVSRRMHPDICRFVSEAVYEGRLSSTPDTARQAIMPAGGMVTRESGIMVLPVAHDGNGQASEEEAELVVRVVTELCSRSVRGQDGNVSSIDLGRDLLFVAPFNAQVRLLRSRLGTGAKIGSVDRFQGQEAAAVVISMCASALDDAPRGARFLLNRNRLNVAVSRAQALTILVASPKLLAVRCGSIEEMRLVNFLCRLWEYATAEGTRPGAQVPRS